jgi:hypothetical protein
MYVACGDEEARAVITEELPTHRLAAQYQQTRSPLLQAVWCGAGYVSSAAFTHVGSLEAYLLFKSDRDSNKKL